MLETSIPFSTIDFLDFLVQETIFALFSLNYLDCIILIGKIQAIY